MWMHWIAAAQNGASHTDHTTASDTVHGRGCLHGALPA